jgi:hypothetical protein
MKISASRLRQDIYRILDEILKTGNAVEIERHGRILKIVADCPPNGKLHRLKKRKFTDESSENFTHIDWSGEWKPTK